MIALRQSALTGTMRSEYRTIGEEPRGLSGQHDYPCHLTTYSYSGRNLFRGLFLLRPLTLFCSLKEDDDGEQSTAILSAFGNAAIDTNGELSNREFY